MAFENLFVRTKRTIGGIQLDTIVTEEHLSPMTVTRNPVEAGSDITDHVIIQPTKLIIQGAVTDTPLGEAALGQIIDSITGLFGTSTSTNITRSQQAYEAFLVLKNNREPLEIDTRLKTYSNMVVSDISVPQDKDTSRMALMTITFEEIITTESATIDLLESDVADSVRKSITATVNKGRQQAQDVSSTASSSVLKTVSGWLGG